MIYYRMMKNTEPEVIQPVSVNNELIDLIYSNSMPTNKLRKEDRVVWSFSKTPEAALTWLGKRGHGLYDRLAYFDFNEEHGYIFDLTDLETWIGLIAQSKRSKINNLNTQVSVDAVRSIIPCMRSALSMARACEEVVIVPAKEIKLNILKEYKCITTNVENAKSVITKLAYSDQTIDMLLSQLNNYHIRSHLKNALIELKSYQKMKGEKHENFQTICYQP